MACDRWRWTNRSGETVPFEDDVALARFIAAHNCEMCGRSAMAHIACEITEAPTAATGFYDLEILDFDNMRSGDRVFDASIRLGKVKRGMLAYDIDAGAKDGDP